MPVVLPRAAEPAPPYRFPVVASLAPVVVSVAVWMITGSVFALLFAALGPVTAVASFVDSRLAGRRARRRERTRFKAEMTAAWAALAAQQASELAELNEVTPDAAAIASRRGADHGRWSVSGSSPARVTVGRGVVASGNRLDRPARAASAHDDETAIDKLVAASGVLNDAPIVVDARLGLGVFGPPTLRDALARGLALQLAWALSPELFWCSQPEGPPGRWCSELPHPSGPGGRLGYEFGPVGSDTAIATIAVAASAPELPGACRVVIGLDESGDLAVLQHPDRGLRQSVATSFVSHDDARAWAMDAAANASLHGVTNPTLGLPAAVSLESLLTLDNAPGAVDSAGLAASVAMSAEGAFSLDLVRQGPHAVVGGTTGSGKSELLIAWVLAMAMAHSPERVNFLLVDFKGGAAFASLAALPHTVGTITDLDARAAERALASLRAELAHRERVLAREGARDIEHVRGLPRLIIIVDEFAAMLTEHPDLHALFADLAARGRSLGVHLVLCTQRPAGAVRDGVLANADLRISLRVNNPSDSAAVVGVDAACAIPLQNRGRALVRVAGAEPTLVQFAIAGEHDARRVAARWPSAPPARRPWMEPLPRTISQVPLVEAGTCFGLVDLPSEQRWAPAVWRPDDGNVLVLGAPGSGKSIALRALAGDGEVLSFPSAIDSAWDCLGHLVQRLDAPGVPTTVLIDDLDALLARFSADHRASVLDRLARVLREGSAHGVRVALSAQRLSGELVSLSGLVPQRLWLRHASRQDLAMAGGDGATHDDSVPPGGGTWRGHRVQVVLRERVFAEYSSPVEHDVGGQRPLAIISTRSLWLSDRLQHSHTVIDLSSIAGDPREALRSDSPGRVVLLADVDEWQSRWGAVAAVRQVADVLFHACSTADFRALTRSRELPPPMRGDPALCWRLEPDGSATRVRLSLDAR